MGCGSVKQNVIIEVAYCGGCGWSLPAKKVCDAIKQKLPLSVIDCRPEEVFTGVLEVNLLLENKEKRAVYKGDKETVLANVEQISVQVEKAYNDV
jgi:hypothetical protein